MRLQRALARAGVASRRKAEDLIRAGSVRVNGQTATIGTSVDPERDVVTVRGRRLTPAVPTWIALHKPLGYVVTRSDPQNRPTVFELLPKVRALTYVGRLDLMTSGLLLLTTDGELAHRLMHPRYAVPRTYRVLVHGRRADEIREVLRRPVVIEGRPVQLVESRVRAQGTSTELWLRLAEGRYRIVRRLCERVGLKVERLTRMSYGPVQLGRLQSGAWRHLSKQELKAIEVTCGGLSTG
jgi:pseudouridine synthase